MTKNEIRRRIREIKSHLSPSLLAEESGEIFRRIENLPQFRDAKTILAYWSLTDEPFSHDFVEKWSREKTVLLPVMCEGDTLKLRRYTEGCAMDTAGFGVCEPCGEFVAQENIDLAMIPGVAFDRSGNRLGRGKGFYDRFLCECGALKIGVCFGFQYLDSIPADTHDIKMDMVIHS